MGEGRLRSRALWSELPRQAFTEGLTGIGYHAMQEDPLALQIAMPWHFERPAEVMQLAEMQEGALAPAFRRSM